MTNNQTAEYMFCHIHDRQEPVTPASVICTECGHVYEDEHNLMLTFEAAFGTEYMRVQDVPYCPLCLHDF